VAEGLAGGLTLAQAEIAAWFGICPRCFLRMRNGERW
jgi:hypothetical protein